MGPLTQQQSLGSLQSWLTRQATTVSADMVCSPVFQVAATDAIARKYGEQQAALFRSALRNATQFCDSGAAVRYAAQQAAAQRTNLYWTLGILGTLAAGIGVWAIASRKTNPTSPRRRKHRSRRHNGHRHCCPCGRCWTHAESAFGDRDKHSCPDCGRVRWARAA